MQESAPCHEPGIGKRAGRGMLWSGLETVGISGVSLVVSVLLARMLAPDSFGLIAMIQIFIAVGQMFAEAGMTQALVRLPSRTSAQEGAAFVINIGLALTFYAMLWVCAPMVADFYHQPQLVEIIRIIGVCIPLNASCVVQHARLTCAMRFKKLALISMVSVLAGGGVGIVLANYGYGVMALVWQQLSMWGVRALLMWCLSQGGVGISFTRHDAKYLTSFGWKLMLAGMIDTIYTNMYAPLVGKMFGLQRTSMYWRADSLARYVPQSLAGVLARVSLPAMSYLRDDAARASAAFAKLVNCTAWIVMPLCATLIALAHPLFMLLLTDKWAEAVPLFQILCLTMALYPLHSLNCTVLNVYGRSDRFLQLELLKKGVGITTLCLTLPWGVTALCWGMCCSSIICLILNICFGSRVSGIGLSTQIRLVCPSVLGALVAGILGWGVTQLFSSVLWQLMAGLMVCVVVYMIYTRMAGMSAMRDIKQIFLK